MSDGLLVMLFLLFNKILGFNKDHSREASWRSGNAGFESFKSLFLKIFCKEDFVKIQNLSYYSLSHFLTIYDIQLITTNTVI